MDEKTFKRLNRPASCNNPPWASVIPSEKREEVLRIIRQETVAAYGYSMDECPKRLVCLTKTCMGRPLPWDSPTAKPYLEALAKRQNVQNGEMFLSNCEVCPIFKTCKATCAQVNDFMNRDRIGEPEMVYKESLDNIVMAPSQDRVASIIGPDLKVPWDALNNNRKQTVKKYLYDQKDFLTIAKDLGFHDQSRARYEFYAALTTLAEYATMRKFLEDFQDELSDKQQNILKMIYVANLTISEVADKEQVTKQAVQQIVARLVKKYNIKWTTFVRKQGNKVIFNVPELMK